MINDRSIGFLIMNATNNKPKVKGLKTYIYIYHHLQGNPSSSGLQLKVEY